MTIQLSLPIRIQAKNAQGVYETAINNIYTAKFGVTASINNGLLDYKIDAEIRTLDLSKVDIEEELDEEVMDDIMDSFKMLFSSGIAKGKVEVGDKTPA